MSITLTAADNPYTIKRSTTDATPDDLLEVILPSWTRTYTVESPTGGSNLKVARTGTDGAAIGTDFVDVVAGAGPRVFVASAGQQSNQLVSIFIASTGISAIFIVEAEAATR